MKNFRLWAILALVVVVAGLGAYFYWNHEVRWRPNTVTEHQAEIAEMLELSLIHI